jgi:hypothetical protein
MSSRKIVTAAVLALSLTLSFPTFAAQPNGARNRETREQGVRNREGRSFVEHVVRAVRRGVVRATHDTLTVPTPAPRP